ncbi:NrsF family protein [Loktanella salsilacus]|uniref:NrsF family protein n=1 Tax=Loktanella salsilacus TaxID=195913 RepID=UPI0037370B2B
MNTDDLIASLGADMTPVRPGLLTNGVMLGLASGAVLTVMLFAALWGVRSDPAAIYSDMALFAKTMLPLALGTMALPWMLAQARPAGQSRVRHALWALPAVLVLLVAATLIATPAPAWPMALQGKSIMTCLVSIPALSAPILAGLLVALRRGAPEHPMRCGMVAGLTAAGFAAAVYSLYCIENSPLFYGTWYTLAILCVAGVGAIAGRVTLKW